MDRRALILALPALAAVIAAPGAALASGGGKKKEPPWLPLRPVTATIVRRDGRRGSLSVELGLNVEDPALRERAAASQPMLRDAYLSALQPYAMGLTAGAPPNTDYIARVFQKETDRVLRRPGARLLIGAVLVN